MWHECMCASACVVGWWGPETALSLAPCLCIVWGRVSLLFDTTTLLVEYVAQSFKELSHLCLPLTERSWEFRCMLIFIVFLNQGFDTLVHHLRKYVMQFCSKKPGKVLRALIFWTLIFLVHGTNLIIHRGFITSGYIFAGESMKLRILCPWTTGNINESYRGDGDNHFSRSRTWSHTRLMKIRQTWNPSKRQNISRIHHALCCICNVNASVFL